MKKNISLPLITVISVLLLISCQTKSKNNTENSPATENQSAKIVPPIEDVLSPEIGIDMQNLINTGYELKQNGQNSAALEKFEIVCNHLIKNNKQKSNDYASCLDDKASVWLRMGNYPKAGTLFNEAKEILTTLKNNPKLITGIDRRLDLIEKLDASDVKCNEPGEPQIDATLPYFPEISEMQAALGKLTPQLADCKKGYPEMVTIRIVITGDGKPIRAYSRGAHSDTEVGTCISNRLLKLIPNSKLPPFRACFRPFTYPFTVGNYIKKSESDSSKR